MESTQTRAEKRASINRRMRDLFLRKPMFPMTASVLRNTLGLPADTAITARIREIRNHPRNPMDIRCERLTFPAQLGNACLYLYRFHPAKTVEPQDGETLPV